MQIGKFIKKNYKKILSTALVAAITVSHCSVPSLATESGDFSLKERFALAKQLDVLEHMEEDGYLSDAYAHPLSFEEMSSGVGPLLRVSDFDEILGTEQLYRVYTDMEVILEEQSAGVEPTAFHLDDISTLSSYSIATYNQISHSNGTTYGSKFTAYTPAGLVDVFCGEHGMSTPTAGDALTNLRETTNENVLKSLYYGYGGPAAMEGKSTDFYLETANAISEYLKAGSGSNVSNAFRATIEAKPAAPSGYKAYIFDSNGGSTQDIVFSIYEPEGSVTLTKTSSNTSITNGSSCYSLSGAVYTIYTDKACTSSTGKTLTTNSSGTTGTAELNEGTYYVKETKAPTGYKLDTEVYTVVVRSGETTTLNVTDKPHYDPIGIMATKSDSDSGQGLEGAQFTIKYYNSYSTSGTPERTWVFETDSRGSARYDESYKVSGDSLYIMDGIYTLPLGIITIQETKAPEGYVLDSTIHTREIKLNSSFDDVITTNVPDVPNEVIRGGVKIQKFDNETGLSTSQGNATFESTTYEIVNNTGGTVYVDSKAYSNGAVVQTLVADANGYVTTANDLLPYGDYTIRETKAPTGYLLEGVLSRTFTITTNGVIIDLTSSSTGIRDDVIRGGVKINKFDNDTKTTTAQGDATLEGAVFEIVNNSSNAVVVDGVSYANGKVVKELTTNSSGYAATGSDLLPYGSYTIREKTAPTGYLLEGVLSRTFTITTNGVIIDLTSSSTGILNNVIRGGVSIEKRDIETGLLESQGNTTFDGVEFTIYSANESTVVVEGKEYSKGDAVATLVVVDGVVKSSNDLLPYGTYTVKETKEPVGYFGTSEVKTFTIREAGVTVELHNDNAFYNQVKRGDLDLTKIEGSTMQRMENIPFKITSKTTGESHVILTDVNGYASTHSSWNPHSQNTNRGETDEDGIWFGDLLALDNDKGALIYDTYIIEELESDNNSVHDIFEPFEITISRDSYTVGLGTVTNELISIDISTYAYNLDGEGKYINWGDVATIVDEVTYKQVPVGFELTMVGILMNKATGKELLTRDGETITAETVFVPEEREGSVDVYLTVDTAQLDLDGPVDMVVYEYLYYGDTLLAKHDDLESLSQRMYMSELDITTEALDGEDGDKILSAGEEVTVIDKVTMEGLIVGKEYTVKGVLMDKATGEAFLVDEEEVRAELTFTAEASKQVVELAFTFDSKGMLETTLVVFENLYSNDRLLAAHTDIEDAAQTVVVKPIEIKTEALDGEDGDKILSAGEEVTVIDKVTMEGLILGREYTVKGVLMDKATGEAFLVDEEEVRAELTFTAESSKQVVELAFTFDSKGMLETTLVVFETLYREDLVVATHEDIEDEAQTVLVKPIRITTEAVESESESHTTFIRREVTIIDTVTMEGLIVGKEYTVKGVLMDKATGEAFLVDEEEVRAELTFTADAVDQVVELAFTFDSKYMEETTLVVFETLYREDLVVATHEDINDEAQSVEFVERVIEIDTVASAPECYEVGDVVEVKDIVTYTNVFIDEEYTIKGVLMDKLTEEVFLVNGEEVVAELTFIPEEEDGEVELTFEFEITEDMGDLNLVVFETMFDADDDIVAEHTDIDDEEQTVYIESPEYDVPNKPKTGDDTNVRNVLLLCGLSALAGVAIFKRRKKDNK